MTNNKLPIASSLRAKVIFNMSNGYRWIFLLPGKLRQAE
jgi:hypothetical protein